jgi:hypothetical protein
MSIESEIARLIDVVEKGFADLTAAIRQSEISYPPMRALSADPTPEPAPTPAPEPAPSTSLVPAPNGSGNGKAKGPSFDEVVAIAQEVARLKTPPVAIKLINQHGAQKLAEMDPAKYPAFYAAAQVLLADATS